MHHRYWYVVAFPVTVVCYSFYRFIISVIPSTIVGLFFRKQQDSLPTDALLNLTIQCCITDGLLSHHSTRVPMFTRPYHLHISFSLFAQIPTSLLSSTC
jgi:hypothetical protein